MSFNSFAHRLFDLEYVCGAIVRQHGETLFEKYRAPCGPADKHQLFSLSKSFTSTAVGIAIGEGKLSLDDKIVSFFPEYLSPAVTERMRAVTVRNLLTMASGHAGCCIIGERYDKLANGRHFDNDRPWVQNILEDELAFEPGSTFVYNTGATYLLSAIVRKATGEGLLDYLRPRFLRPAGITDDVVWDRDPEGIELGGWGFNLSVRDIAAAAEVWLHYGKGPGGRQLVPEDFMRLATSKQISNGDPAVASDWTQGYGFQFWQCQHGFFRGDGAAGQLAVMLPKYDAVVAVTAGLCDMQRELNVIWEELVPALEAGERPNQLDDFTPRYNMGPVGVPNAAFSATAFDVGPNKLELASAALRQVPGGLELSLRFDDGHEDVVRAGYEEDRRSALTHVSRKHTFEGYGRARWLSPTVAELKVALPSCPSFFTFTFDTAVPSLHSHTPIWFCHHWKSDVTVTGSLPIR